MFFLQNDLEIIEGRAMKFVREKETWFTITIDSSVQGQGKGSQLLNKLIEHEQSLNGWVIDHDSEIKQSGEIYNPPLPFYLKNDFLVYPEIRL